MLWVFNQLEETQSSSNNQPTIIVFTLPCISYLRLWIISNSSQHIFLWENKTLHISHGPYISSPSEKQSQRNAMYDGGGETFCCILRSNLLENPSGPADLCHRFTGNRPWRYPSSPKQRVQLRVFLSNGKRRERRSLASLIRFSINLLVVYRESVNLIGYITRRLSADSPRQDSCSRDCIYVTFFQTWISTHGANGAPRLNLMKHNETVLFYALLDTFFLLCN